MVQGSGKKSSASRPGEIRKSAKTSAKFQNKIKKQQTKLKKGTPVQLRKDNFHLEALDERDLTRAINRSNEQKIAAKVISQGGKLKLNDIKEQGKELNRETKRKLLKKKVSRVQEKLVELEKKAEEKGLV
jgi:Skp family chaperone for outer membrane proteins